MVQKKSRLKEIFEAIDRFSKLGWRVVLKKLKAQEVYDAIENILTASKHQSKLLETDDGNEFVARVLVIS